MSLQRDLFALPADMECYDARPDILSVEALAHPELGENWRKIRQGILEATAMLIEAYPDATLLFVGRDAEPLYDFARAMTQNDPEAAARLRLINVSSRTSSDSGLRLYLEAEGITQETLEQGQKFVVVDSGYRGTVADGIAKVFPEKFHGQQIQGHFLNSSNPRYPSTRVYDVEAAPFRVFDTETSSDSHQGNIEVLPHWSQSSASFAEVDGRWRSVSYIERNVQDETRSRQAARIQMEDILAFSRSAEAEALFARRRGEWRRIRPLMMEKNPAALTKALQKMLAGHSSDAHLKGFIIDALEIREKNYGIPNGHGLTPEALGVKYIHSAVDPKFMNLPPSRPTVATESESLSELPRERWGALRACIKLLLGK